MEIKSLARTGFDTIFRAFSQAFADYELQLNKEQLQAMLKRRGFDPDLSFAAFDGSEIVAFTLNGIGNFNGISTAYDTGTGTLKEYRGQGLATRIFDYSIPYLKENNIRQYLLEVLQHNTKAVSVYRNLGFEVVREFYYFNGKNEGAGSGIKTPEVGWTVQSMDPQLLRSVSCFWDFYPSWQNSFESIERVWDAFVYLGAFDKDKWIGYGVFEPISGDITQLAVDHSYRRKGVASLLLNEMVRLNKNEIIKAINTDIRCDSVTGFLEAKNIKIKGKQFEMIKKI